MRNIALVCLAVIGAAGTAEADTVYKEVVPVVVRRDVQERPYVAQPVDRVMNAGQASVGTQVSTGRRAGRALQNGGFENVLGMAFGASDRISVEGYASLAQEMPGASYGVGARFHVVRQDDGLPINVLLGANGLREYGGTPVAQAVYTVGRDFGKLNVATSGVFEKAFAPDRDEVDAVLSLGTAYAVVPWIRLGIEAVGEDLEAFFEEEEAEGGARFVAGPTLVMELLERRLNFGVNAGGGLAYVERPTPTGDPVTKTAFVTRARLAYTF